jgi:hypothetical protein
MSRNQSFVRKVIYIAIIALLLLPLSALSQPATVGPKNRPELSSPGGKLSQLRAEYSLAQAELGEIDPASETMKLASLGLRGVAANILWGWAHHYKKVEDWDKVELTVNQIIRLQPNFLKVWDFQAHNLSYNISTEFDDYRMRYTWVKKGIDFLIDGTYYNRNEPGILSQVGWYVGQKLGRSDEKQQFRVMFKTDNDFHQRFRDSGVEVDQLAAMGPDNKPDNWLVSRLWYNKANDAVTSLGKPIRGMSPVLFYGRMPMSRINAADAMQKDGFFFDRTKIVWEQAAEEWRAYGDRELPTVAGYSVRMNDKEPLQQHITELRAEVEKLAPGLAAKLREEKLSNLTPEQRAILGRPPETWSVDDRFTAEYAEGLLIVAPQELLARAPREARPQVRPLVDQMLADQALILDIDRNRNVVAFEYWRMRVAAERTNEARQARKDVYDAGQLFAKGVEFEEARKLYERAWTAWGKIFEEHYGLMNNPEARDLIDSIARYRDLLGHLDLPFPADFPLNKLLDMHNEGIALREQIRLIQGSGAPATAQPKPDESKEAKPEEKKSEEGKPGEKTEEAKPVEAKPDEAKTEPKEPADAPATEGKPESKEPSGATRP